ncbi:hypothetical protein J6590_074514 [Homalodisca vitripennis]|nr:hypothetical protein J6590_074514 [Homalodisca vitripennis]
MIFFEICKPSCREPQQSSLSVSSRTAAETDRPAGAALKYRGRPVTLYRAMNRTVQSDYLLHFRQSHFRLVIPPHLLHTTNCTTTNKLCTRCMSGVQNVIA